MEGTRSLAAPVECSSPQPPPPPPKYVKQRRREAGQAASHTPHTHLLVVATLGAPAIGAIDGVDEGISRVLAVCSKQATRLSEGTACMTHCLTMQRPTHLHDIDFTAHRPAHVGRACSAWVGHQPVCWPSPSFIACRQSSMHLKATITLEAGSKVRVTTL